ncbi:2OG-Fe dioxygenase family protein [Pseudomonas sp. H9]|uniref:2OG-Fe dioxygenase family protein n=1 Tax=Pseudomonas sp. H9 TaxID=483968 RepID=UPI001404C586|nr:2OG-Fe dioxygenase family protein [Pseudomonas sp. H9]
MFDLSEALKRDHYVTSARYPAQQVAQLGDEVRQAFNATWDDLPSDSYLTAEYGARERRICKFDYHQHDRRWRPLQDCHFFQTQADNPLLGGVERLYTRSCAAFIDSPVLHTLLAADLALMDLTVGAHDWRVTCHQFRTLCDQQHQGQATPEGRHRDGHDFVFQHLIKREAVIGGESRIFRDDGATVFSATLTGDMETIALNDRRLLHEVSPLKMFNGALQGIRDMLIIDFDRVHPS